MLYIFVYIYMIDHSMQWYYFLQIDYYSLQPIYNRLYIYLILSRVS